ncbi:sulfite exporter TauE/SafE family protein [Enterococcus sp. LJL120]
MMGIIYFLIILFANSIGAISGMGGGVLIKPLLDLIGAHSVPTISFYSTVAVFTMAVVSTIRQLLNGIQIKGSVLSWIVGGAILGGVVGNFTFEKLLAFFSNEDSVQLIQIVLTILTLIFAFLFTHYNWKSFHLSSSIWCCLCGLILGFLASLLGIGGGPINVALIMLMFGFPIKEATIYSICVILFSQLAKILTITFGTGFARYDLSMLFFIIPAAAIGGLVGAKFSNLLSAKNVTTVFQAVILLVLVINIYNGYQILN